MVIPEHNSRQSVAVPALANGKRQGAVASKRIPGMASHSEHARQLSEYALEQLQLFFSKRPSAALVKFFTMSDDDFNGSLGVPEFQSAIARFMELPEAASHALFDAIDYDHSGVIELRELLAAVFPRQRESKEELDFFWKARRAVPGAEQRQQWKSELIRAAEPVMHLEDGKIDAILQKSVQQRGARKSFQGLDENRNGHIQPHELAIAMARRNVLLSDEQARRAIERINQMAGTPERKHLAFDAFCAAFERTEHGIGAKILGTETESELTPRRARPVAESPRRKASRRQHADFEAKIMEVFALVDENHNGEVSRNELVHALRDERTGRDMRVLLGLPPDLRGAHLKRFDTIFGFIDGDHSHQIDAKEFASCAAHACCACPLHALCMPFGRPARVGIRLSDAFLVWQVPLRRLRARAPGRTLRRQGLHRPASWRWRHRRGGAVGERPGGAVFPAARLAAAVLGDQPAAVAGAAGGARDAAAHRDGRADLAARGGRLPHAAGAAATHDDGREAARARGADAGAFTPLPAASGWSPSPHSDAPPPLIRSTPRPLLACAVQAAIDARDHRDELRKEAALRHKHHLVTRNADLQLLHDSSTETTGKKVVELVPPAVGGWKPAPPHVASHWGTISQHYQDPPPVRRRW